LLVILFVAILEYFIFLIAIFIYKLRCGVNYENGADNDPKDTSFVWHQVIKPNKLALEVYSSPAPKYSCLINLDRF
jgi:ABC-type transport system substrate-binding protein